MKKNVTAVVLASTATTPASRGDAWTPEEDAILLAAAREAQRRRRPIDWSKVPISRHTTRTLRTRAMRLAHEHGIKLCEQRWTAEEDKVLRESWTECGRRTILARLPGRSWVGIVQRATRDLGLSSIPQGWVMLKGAARELGLGLPRARTLVAWARAWSPLVEALCAFGHAAGRAAGLRLPEAPPRWDGGEIATAKHTTTHTTACEAKRWTLVEEGALEEALERWNAWWDTPTAASRWDVDCWQMRQWTVAAGFGSPHRAPPLRLPPSWWEDVAATRGLARGGASISEHARRRGIPDERLRRALRAAGYVARGRGWKAWLTDAQVDEMLSRRPA